MEHADEVSVDESTEVAWREFRRQLADRIAQLGDGDSFVVEVEGENGDADVEDGCTPYVQAASANGERGQAEISSNHYLHRRHRLDKAARRGLRKLGWLKPSQSDETFNYSVDFALSRADQVAVMMVKALREVFGVVHPAFLVVPWADSDEAGEATSCTPVDEPLARKPSHKGELDEFMEQTLTGMFGHPPVRDSDGDIGVASGTAVVFIRAMTEQPVVHLFAELAVAVTDRKRARFEVGVLNRSWPQVKFALVDDTVLANLYVPAMPFAPEHLRQSLTIMCEMAEAVDADLAVRVGGRTFLPPSTSDIHDSKEA